MCLPIGALTRSFSLLEVSDRDRFVLARKAVRLYLFRKSEVSRVIFRNYQQPARVFIDPVDDSWMDHAVDSGKTFAAVIQQRVHESSVVVSVSGVNHHSFRLVDHEQIVIFIHDIKRNIFGLRIERLRVGDPQRSAFHRLGVCSSSR